MTLAEFNQENPIDGLEVIETTVLSVISGSIYQGIPGDFSNIQAGTPTEKVTDITVNETHIVWGEIEIPLDTELN